MTGENRRNGRISHNNVTLIQSYMDRRMIELEPPRTDFVNANLPDISRKFRIVRVSVISCLQTFHVDMTFK